MADTAWRLARALLRAAVAEDRADAVAADLGRLAELLASGPDVRRFLNHPLIAPAEKEKVFAPALREPLVRRLFGALVSARETQLVPDIRTNYTRLLASHAGSVEVDVRSVRPLSSAEADAVRAEVGRRTGRTADLRVTVDPALLGGLRVQVEGRVIDNSLRAALEALKERLLAV